MFLLFILVVRLKVKDDTVCMCEQNYNDINMTVKSLNLFIADGQKIRNTMTTMREAGLSRPEAGLDPRLTANGAPKAPKEEEECHVSQKLAVLQEESLKPIKEDLAEWIARTLGNLGGVNVRLSSNSTSHTLISLMQ